MHPNRRRKKRPNYGLRTVEVARGPNGFGFTISGQQPCILSCIVAHSPADIAGLRAGDFLISVNGTSVSKIAHDAVVNLIGRSMGPICMTIAEHYYSDSSDEDTSRVVTTRKHKPRLNRSNPNQNTPRRKKDEPHVSPVCYPVCNPMEEEGGPIEYKAIVGYLGTIEMPKQMPPNARLQTVNACIKKLRQEKRKPTAVLMTVLPTCLTLKNAVNHILAIYPTNRVVYISTTADKESRYFGLVTSAVCDRSLENVQKKCETYLNIWEDRKCNNDEKGEFDVSNSCHVFVTDPKIIEHSVHAQKADSFRIACTKDAITGFCLEFPCNALYIVSLVQNMYRLQAPEENKTQQMEDLVAISPLPSASSNSDSGIGFRDDCANVSDRILLVEFPAPNNKNRPINIIASMEKLDNLDNSLNNVRAMPVSSAMTASSSSLGAERSNINNIRACENITNTIRNALDVNFPNSKQNNLDQESHTFEERPIDVNFESDNISLHSSKSLDVDVFKKPQSAKKKRRLFPFSATSCDNLDYKLSPKVYLDHKRPSKKSISSDDFDFGGSLKDLTSFGRKLYAFAASEPDVRLEHFDIQECEDNVTVKACGDGPAAWATSFEELLKCPAGLHTFAEFLKKEFSAENIYFWTACERFSKITSTPERSVEALKIFNQHLRIGAPEAVNVDSKARQCAEQHLHNVPANMFVAAQKQIFNLMKFDSYTRFLKSELYKRCLSGHGEDYKLDPSLQLVNGPSAKPKRSLSNAEDRRRKSLLPWSRKNRSKSKEYEEPKPLRHDLNENVDISSSKSSLTSLDIGITSNSDIGRVNDERMANGRHPLCRVKLTNGNSTMTQVNEGETIEELVKRLLEKRGITYSAFAVYTNKEAKALNINDSALKLAGCEVDIEQRVSFKLNLPNKKIIAVKSKSTKVLVDVLRPILEKYSYTLEQVVVTSSNEPVNVNLQVTAYDEARITVQLKEKPPVDNPITLEEITNRIYEDILHEKATDVQCKTRTESVKSEEWGSEHSSNLAGRFLILKRDSERNRKKKLTRTTPLSIHSSLGDETLLNEENPMIKKPLIAKLKVGVQLHNTSESEDLYEGLNRAQRGRLDDQRGTKINYAMPDFLKGQAQIIPAKPERTNVTATAKNLKLELHSHSDYENQNINGCRPLFNLEKSKTMPNLVPDNVIKVEPPPLPPKPKIVPMKPSNWKPRQVLKDCSYLEQPTSSFV